MKMYKGFDRNMTCRGFKFEEGKEYEENEAILCKTGFHACEDPLECFKHYSPGRPSVYHEVDLDCIEEKSGYGTTKRVGKRIKIGKKLSVEEICKEHYNYIDSKFKTRRISQCDGNYLALKTDESHSALSVRDHSAINARDLSSLSAKNYSSLSAGDYSSLSAGSNSALSAGDYSVLSSEISSSLSAKNHSSLSAKDFSSLSARDFSTLSAGNYASISTGSVSAISAGSYSEISAGSRSSISAGMHSVINAKHNSVLSAEEGSDLSAGKNSIIAAFNSRAKGDIGTILVLATREVIDDELKITDYKAAIIDGITLKADVWYTLKDGNFVEERTETD